MVETEYLKEDYVEYSIVLSTELELDECMKRTEYYQSWLYARK